MKLTTEVTPLKDLQEKSTSALSFSSTNLLYINIQCFKIFDCFATLLAFFFSKESLSFYKKNVDRYICMNEYISCIYIQLYLSLYVHQFVSVKVYISALVLIIYVFTKPSTQAGCDTRSIFKQSLTGLNPEFSFSWTGCHTVVT